MRGRIIPIILAKGQRFPRDWAIAYFLAFYGQPWSFLALVGVSFNICLCIITIIQVYVPTSNAEKGEIEWFYEDLQDLLELTPKKDVLFIIGDWNTKVGSQEIPGVTGKFGLGEQNEAGQRLTELCQENALVIANNLFQQHKRRLHIDMTRWPTLESG